MADNVVSLIPAGKIRCYISGSLRRDTKEENVRQRWARSLVEEYGYLKADIAVEFPIKMGSSRKRADIVVFKEGAARKQENVYIIIEAKTEDTLPTAGEGLAQLKTYMSASFGCRYGMWVGSEKIVVEKVNGSLEDGVGDIPSKGDMEPKPPVFLELAPAVELNAVFKRCHNYIYANQGVQKAEAFHELLKLIFCKVYDETESTGELQFYIWAHERRSEAGQRRVYSERIEPLFEHVKERYPYIFESSERIKLKRRVLSYIVSELQRISLLRTKADVKGSAYEELVGANLRGDRGEFFTPRNVCDMAVRMAIKAYPRQRLSSLKVIDVCCGTGGFLVSYLNALRELFTDTESAKRGGPDIASIVGERVKDVCSRNMFGLDINPFLVRTCQMNLVMHGDGSSNVFPVDSLLSPAEWDSQDALKRVPYGKADIVLTNPPFGSKAMIDDPHVLSKFELSGYQSTNPRSTMPVEQLFVEAALKFLKPGGFIAIVLPDGVLNNPSLEFIRRWLVRRVRLVATVDLPKETFATSGGVPNPSVLLMQRFTREEVKLAEQGALEPYDVFMATPKTAGINKRGNPVYVRLPSGMEILDDSMQPVIDDEIALVAGRFGEWVRHGRIG